MGSQFGDISQEDPFKLVILSKGSQNASVSSADFFFGLDGRLSFISSGEDGVLRALEFNPNRESHTPDSSCDLQTYLVLRCNI